MPRVITDVFLDRWNDDPTPSSVIIAGQRQERVGGTMVTVPERVSSQTQNHGVRVSPMATQVRPYAKKDGIRFHRGLPDPSHLTKWFGPARGGVLVLDDFMEEGGQDQRVLDLFTKDSDHRNITVLYLTQDLFPPGKFSKTINRNAHYIVAFKTH